MSAAKIIDMPAPKPVKVKVSVWKAGSALILMMFIVGLSIGSCSLGMKLPVALYNMAVEQQR